MWHAAGRHQNRLPAQVQSSALSSDVCQLGIFTYPWHSMYRIGVAASVPYDSWVVFGDRYRLLCSICLLLHCFSPSLITATAWWLNYWLTLFNVESEQLATAGLILKTQCHNYITDALLSLEWTQIPEQILFKRAGRHQALNHSALHYLSLYFTRVTNVPTR